MLRTAIFALLVSIGAETLAQQIIDIPAQYSKPEANAISGSIWPYRSIGVCWENPDAASDAERSWVVESVRATWQTEGNVEFVGWQRCASPPQKGQGIRIRIEDVSNAGPHVKAVGRFLDGLPSGMSLNFNFQNWSPACQGSRELCIRSIAIHEFGHALGLAHEQNSPQAPEWCRAHRQGSDGDWLVTPFDMLSVMNYCRTGGTLTTQLSEYDKKGIKTIYPALTQGSVDSNAWYRLITRVTAQCIHVQNANANRRNAMWQWPCEQKPEFKFQFEKLPDGYYRIRSIYGQCFHVRSDVPQARRAPLWQWECEDKDEFKFLLESAGDDWYRIRSKAGTCFHVSNGPTMRAREALWSWECVNQPEFYLYLQRANF